MTPSSISDILLSQVAIIQCPMCGPIGEVTVVSLVFRNTIWNSFIVTYGLIVLFLLVLCNSLQNRMIIGSRYSLPQYMLPSMMSYAQLPCLYLPKYLLNCSFLFVCIKQEYTFHAHISSIIMLRSREVLKSEKQDGKLFIVHSNEWLPSGKYVLFQKLN